MTTSQRKSVLSEIEGNEPLSDGARAYLCERVRNDYYDYVLTKFHEANETRGLTKADIARRLNLGPDRVSKLLGAPGNWTIDTVTELLIAICREENTPHSVSYLNRKAANLGPDTCLTLNTGVKVQSEVFTATNTVADRNALSSSSHSFSNVVFHKSAPYQSHAMTQLHHEKSSQ